jgi:hypothetical protein
MPSRVCMVGPVEKNLIGPTGYSFKLIDNRAITARPIVTLVYERQLDAANAQFIVEQALMHVIDVRVD